MRCFFQVHKEKGCVPFPFGDGANDGSIYANTEAYAATMAAAGGHSKHPEKRTETDQRGYAGLDAKGTPSPATHASARGNSNAWQPTVHHLKLKCTLASSCNATSSKVNRPHNTWIALKVGDSPTPGEGRPSSRPNRRCCRRCCRRHRALQPHKKRPAVAC